MAKFTVPLQLFSGGLDPLRDENFAFVARLKAAGVPVRHVHFPDVVHAYLMLENLVRRRRKPPGRPSESLSAATEPRRADTRWCTTEMGGGH
ncbi:alpha/beta hydrolase [Enterobacter asburiae]|uniref:alpha/beta hydrolase n=1 Tax=Enterobacter asburiae TaxID=61645 RepID=UPI003F5649A3